MKQKGRSVRVAELIREEIAKLLTKGVKDPRIGFVSVMSVAMSPDLRYANVYVSLFGDEKERKSSLVGLQRSAGWMRREIGRYLRMRVTPELRFFPDDTLDTVYHLEEVFQQIHEDQQSSPMIRLSLEQVLEEIQKASSFLLTTHANPDGDAVGSLLGMLYLLKALGKDQIYCVMADPVPKRYQSLPGAKLIKTLGKNQPVFDMAVVLDVSSRDRLEAVNEWIGEDKPVLVIDHHLGEGPGGSSGFIDPSYAATGEIVAELFRIAAVAISKDAARCLYVAQITDTGGYRFSNTTPRSHQIAAGLLETGLDVAAISAEVFDVIPRKKMELLKRMLTRLQFDVCGRIAWSYVTKADMDEVTATKEDLDGLVNYARNAEGVWVGALFTEPNPGETKVSLRTDSHLNAADFLASYGGGGHAAASGATLQMPLNEAMGALIPRLEETLATMNHEDK